MNNSCLAENCDTLPDVAHESKNHLQGTLDWVGMSNIAVNLNVPTPDGVKDTKALAQAYVSLDDATAKGIHMSRLYLQLDEYTKGNHLSIDGLLGVMLGFISTHEGLSDKAFIELRFDTLLRRDALLSNNSGWKAYPTIVCVQGSPENFTVELTVNIPYSSTCPCSAALSRSLIQARFEENFANKVLSFDEIKAFLGDSTGINATPHSQRSIAQVKVKLNQTSGEFPTTTLINLVEDALKTPVQTAVKREDEQEFARLNAANLMFCEDAGRKVKHALDVDSTYADFWLRINHMESLHAHDAVSIVTKGVAGGYLPIPSFFSSK